MDDPEPRWAEHGRWVWFRHGSDDLRAEHVKDWWQPGEIAPTAAWVVWLFDDAGAHRALVELGGAPLVDGESRQRLVAKARRIAAKGAPPSPPRPVVFSEPTTTIDGKLKNIELSVLGLESAAATVTRRASRLDDDSHLRMAVVNAMAWLRLVDEVFGAAWSAAPRKRREEASSKTDRQIERLMRSGSALPAFVEAHEQRQTDGKPYRDWSMALFAGSLLQSDFVAYRWLAGKLLHLGPRPAVELVQYVVGAEPRWKWRNSQAIAPDAPDSGARAEQRKAYDSHVAGRDVVGSLNVGYLIMQSAVFFRRLYVPKTA